MSQPFRVPAASDGTELVWSVATQKQSPGLSGSPCLKMPQLGLYQKATLAGAEGQNFPSVSQLFQDRPG